MSQLDRLIRDARRSMRLRNHEPEPTRRFESGAIIYCGKCWKSVDVVVKQQPNQTNISGEAAALNCNVATSENKFAEVLLTIPADSDEISMEAVMGC